jgi:hypothetical protein
MTTWVRGQASESKLNYAPIKIASISNGDTYLRVHLRWGFYFDSPIASDLQLLAQANVAFGVVTTIGDGTETVPSPIYNADDAAPPSQRWIYWETRAPVPVALSQAAGLVLWRDSGSTEVTTTKGQVLATGIPGGQFLNLWTVWDSLFDYTSSGVNPAGWASVSVLSKI